VGGCTDGAPAVMESRSGFQKKFKKWLLKQTLYYVSFTDVRLLADLHLLL